MQRRLIDTSGLAESATIRMIQRGRAGEKTEETDPLEALWQSLADAWAAADRAEGDNHAPADVKYIREAILFAANRTQVLCRRREEIG